MITRLRTLFIVIIAAITLNGCVQYDLGIEFQDQNHGQITQQIQLSKQFTDFSAEAIAEWTESIENRVKTLGGTVESVSEENLQVSIPFYNGAELEQKLNQFFSPVEPQSDAVISVLPDQLPQLSSQLSLTQQNFVFVLRNRFSLDLDLRGLALTVTENQIAINSNGVIDFDFSLITPWGAQVLQSSQEAGSQPLAILAKQDRKQLIWQLQPGEINHIEAIFWLPSFVGIGTAIILLFILLGSLIRYRLFPLKSAMN